MHPAGEHQCQLEVNRKTDDREKLSNAGMYTCLGGVELLANTWSALYDHLALGAQRVGGP